MVNTVNKIPSINLPLTNEQGMIHPIWYEFLRSFISSVGDTGTGTGADNTIIAGAGIEGTGAVSTVNVGQGEGLVVNANDVAVNITGQINAQAAPEDEILISDASDQSRIRKTSLRDVANLSPGTFPGGNTTNVQYNSNGLFSGDSGFTYDGAGTVGINSAVTINGTTISSTSSSNKFIFNVPGGTATDHYTFRQTTGTGSSDMPVRFASNLASTDLIIDNKIDGGGATNSESRLKFARQGTTLWTMGLDGSGSGSNFIMSLTALNSGFIYKIDGTTNNMAMSQSFQRSTAASLTASTTQTQGQGALTADINEVSTVANANDVRTLPAALAGRHCLVINNGANTLQVFPASGDDLGAGVNTSTTIASGSRKLFVAYDSTNWEPVV
jgi:hypothetical protein